LKKAAHELLAPQFFDHGEHAAPKFVSNVETNTKRYLSLFTNAASGMLPPPNRCGLVVVRPQLIHSVEA
jgi:hypothetical protein